MYTVFLMLLLLLLLLFGKRPPKNKLSVNKQSKQICKQSNQSFTENNMAIFTGLRLNDK